MTASTISTPEKSDKLLLHCIASFFTMFLLYFIDSETSLSTFSNPGVWLGITLCSIVILFAQALVRELFLLKYNGRHKTKLTLLIGIPLGLIFLYTIPFLMRN